jgi:aspartate aminotransferase
MRISQRSEKLPASPIRKLVPYADEAEKSGTHVYHLNIGQPDLQTPGAYFESIRKYEGVDAYTNSAGLLELREKFSAYYKKWNIPFETEDIIVTEGGSEAVTFAMAAVADPGEEIIVIEPFYANYRAFASFLDVKVVPVTSKAENGYRMPPLSEFERVLTSKTRAILFPNPGNPTGAVYTREELESIAEFAKRHDLYIISDEVYREITFDGLKAHSMMEFDNDNVIIVDSLSKRFNICGARIGAFATKNREIFQAVMKMAMMRLCPNRLSQIGAISLFNLDDSYFEEVKNEYQRRRNIVYEEMKKIDGVVGPKPEGAFYYAAKIPVDDAEKFVKWMLEEFSFEGKTTMVSPLNGFYVTPSLGKDEIRIAYVLKEKELKEACEILREGIKAYNSLKEKV